MPVMIMIEETELGEGESLPSVSRRIPSQEVISVLVEWLIASALDCWSTAEQVFRSRGVVILPILYLYEAVGNHLDKTS
jgi:hypothetical protein